MTATATRTRPVRYVPGLNVRAGTVTIADRPFPICGLICPDPDGETPDRRERVLGTGFGRYGGGVYVPLENGALIQLEHEPESGTWDVYLASDRCVQSAVGTGDEPLLWVPRSLCLEAGEMFPEWPGRPASVWNAAEPDWVAEHLDRLSGYRCDLGAGPRARRIGVQTASRLCISWLNEYSNKSEVPLDDPHP